MQNSVTNYSGVLNRQRRLRTRKSNKKYDFVQEKGTRNTISCQKKTQELRFRTRDKRTPHTGTCLVDQTGRKTAGKPRSREIDAKQRYELDNDDFEPEKATRNTFSYQKKQQQEIRFRTRKRYKRYDFVPEKATRIPISYQKNIQNVRFRIRDKRTLEEKLLENRIVHHAMCEVEKLLHRRGSVGDPPWSS